jgi:methionyl-tRNA formyltransferase
MTGQVDAGDIVGQRAAPIEANETAGELAERLSRLGARLVMETIREIPLDEVERRRQTESQATQAPRLRKADGQIQWGRPAMEVHNRIRGMTPWPGAFTHFASGSGKPPVRLAVERSVVSPAAGTAEPGVIVASGPEGIDVAAGKGTVRLLEVTPAGKRTMRAADFANGQRLAPGMRFLCPDGTTGAGRA